VAARLGEANQPDLVVVTDLETSIELMQRRVPPRQALKAGKVAIVGTLTELERWIDLLAWIPRDDG
jgi:hypothetical protein